ncbi:DUF4167 domain-containing protein [Bartonella raoultii]|uniref:DUF4167 domain-containing protein n=1 Tax=Bartonella raoultii TaxID=1457020 RepID=A0ABS7I3V8_9HYPH|nr:DUF4167 domain-containing protein [Bartonella raoultii]MBX4335265.1 DUF4167 domain-containing protein [Bartonella raoultii]
MRPQQNRRVRGRNNNNNNRRGPNPLSRNYESSGPDVKIRGNAQQIADKYISLARDAQGAGDRVMSENYLQHAEHYLRIILASAGQNSQSARREENRDENNGQECSEINVEAEQPDAVTDDTEASQTQVKKNGYDQSVKTQNGQAGEDTLETAPVLEKKVEQEQSTVEENPEPVKKTRRSSRRRTVRAQEDATSQLALVTAEAAENGKASKEKASSLSVVGEEIQRKPRRRRVVTSSAEENV